MNPHTCRGQIRVHPAGYGFVQREDGEDDVFVSAKNRGAAMDGDRISVVTWMGYKGTEGRVLEVLARGRARLSGVLQKEGHKIYLLPDDPRLRVSAAQIALSQGPVSAREGQSVVAEITRYPSHPDEQMVARVIEVLGQPGRPSTEIAKIILCSDVPDEFPEEVRHAAERAPQEVQKEDLVDRLDLRDRHFVTIDPENARDFDDAMCLEPEILPGTDRLWVAVADVSHYVNKGSVLDRESQVRGCSVYLPDRVIPMLPLSLSAGICSLNPDVDRLAMVVALDIDRHGRVKQERICAAVIRSKGRLDYPGVAAALSGDLRGSHARYKEHLPHLKGLQEVATRLRELRLARGSLDFDLPEAKVLLDELDKERVIDVVRARGSAEVRDAYRLVEDCMLAANEAVARFFKRRKLPVVYRVHDVPDEERLMAFAALAESHGMRFDAEQAKSPLYLKGFLDSLKGSPMEQALSYLLLRALKKAHYDTSTIGHFGLAASDYLHFTSPIRRYPDLLVHRLAKAHLRREGLPGGGLNQDPLPSEEELSRLAMEASNAERRAMEVEREVVDMYRACLMADRVGEDYDGTIVGITAFGIFVALDAPYVEGMLKTDRLGGDYEFDEHMLRLYSRTGDSFVLGDRVRVRVEAVSLARRKIEFGLVAKQEQAARGEVKPRAKPRPKFKAKPKPKFKVKSKSAVKTEVKTKRGRGTEAEADAEHDSAPHLASPRARPERARAATYWS